MIRKQHTKWTQGNNEGKEKERRCFVEEIGKLTGSGEKLPEERVGYTYKRLA
jgi:hypothetical protein